jgi:hypothetical protein
MIIVKSKRNHQVAARVVRNRPNPPTRRVVVVRDDDGA